MQDDELGSTRQQTLIQRVVELECELYRVKNTPLTQIPSMNKRKIIQVVPPTLNTNMIVLCDDGTMWWLNNSDYWIQWDTSTVETADRITTEKPSERISGSQT